MASSCCSTEISKWLTLSITLVSASAVYFWSTRRSTTDSKDNIIKELQKSLKESMGKCAPERQGRIRAQQDLRKAMLQPKTDNLETSNPMAPLAVIRSCFSTRNGTPRQPLIVPLARARLIFDTARVPPASLEGLEEYSHCWIIHMFHLNTDLEKLWKDPSRCKLKAKVRVPRMKGEKMGLFATRSPHRPCPIGLTVVKVESVEGTSVLLSGVDLVDGIEAERKIPINYASRYSSKAGGLQKSAYLPFKVNSSGVMPIIFSTSSLALPGTLARFTGLNVLKNAAICLNPGGAFYLPTNILLIGFFNYYYTFLQLDPDDVSEQLKRQGASIPIVQPGKKYSRIHQNGAESDISFRVGISGGSCSWAGRGGTNDALDSISGVCRYIGSDSCWLCHGHREKSSSGDNISEVLEHRVL